jgi:capsular polysaccharide biosynthesis protein
MFKNKTEVSLRDLFLIFVKNLWIIIICAVLCGTAVYVYNKNYVVPVYQTEVMFYIVPVSTNTLDSDYYNEAAKLQLESQSLAYAKQIQNTYLHIFQTRTFISKLSDDYFENYNKDMNGNISVIGIEDSQLFKIQVASFSKNDAYEIAQQIEKTAPETILEIVGNDNIRIVDKAVEPEFPINNNITRNTLIGSIIGVVFIYGIILLIFIFDKRIKSEEDLKNYYDIPILGSIMDFNKIYKKIEIDMKTER